MEATNQFTKDMISKENQNSTFNGDVKETSTFEYGDVWETATCECGNEFESLVKTGGFDKERETCSECFKKEREKNYELEYKKQTLKEYLKSFYQESLINEKLKQAGFDSYHPTNEQLTKAKEIGERYASIFDLDKPRNLLLIGNYGTGKSHLAVSIAKEIMHKKYMSTLFISTPKLLTELRSTYNRNSVESEGTIINRLSRVSLLVLDDLGSEQSKPSNDTNEQTWATSKIFEIIDNRIGRHTIFTTNYDLKELQQRLGGRIFSRMMENTHPVKMYGDDYRLKDFK
jgi:DNA replication protein DnaC